MHVFIVYLLFCIYSPVPKSSHGTPPEKKSRPVLPAPLPTTTSSTKTSPTENKPGGIKLIPAKKSECQSIVRHPTGNLNFKRGMECPVKRCFYRLQLQHCHCCAPVFHYLTYKYTAVKICRRSNGLKCESLHCSFSFQSMCMRAQVSWTRSLLPIHPPCQQNANGKLQPRKVLHLLPLPRRPAKGVHHHQQCLQ